MNHRRTDGAKGADASRSFASAAKPRAALPNALSIAGIDPSGGAGLFADLKAFAALGAYGTGVVAALTAQNTRAVTGVHPVSADFVRLQLDTLFADVHIDAAKIGMLGTAAVASAVAEGIATPVAQGRLPHRVVDPVMVAKSGDVLLDRDAIGTLIDAILPLATMITPNLPEAGVLLHERAPETPREMRRAAERLRRLLADDGLRFVLLKGGHASGDPIDLLHDGDRMIELAEARVETRNTHGTGCTLSAAIAALLARGLDPVDAVREAKRYLTEALRRADELDVGSGHGPVHHFHLWWKR